MGRKFSAIAVVCAMVLALSGTPAYAQQDGNLKSLRAVTPQDVEVDTHVPYEGDEFYQGVDTTCLYNLSRLVNYDNEDGWSVAVTSISGTGSVRCDPIEFGSSNVSITAERAGAVTITCTETWTDYGEEWDAEAENWVETSQQQSQSHSFAINVLELKNTSGTQVGYVSGGSTSKSFTFKLSDLPANSEVSLISDSNKKGGTWFNGKAEQGKVALYVYGIGTHIIKLKAYGKTITCTAVLRELSLKATADVKNTGSLVTYAGKKSTVAVKLSGVKNPKATWTSTNSKIAKVTKKGVVKARGKGRCYLKAKVGGASLKVLVEVTSKNAYQAVQNGFADMRTKLTYSQPNRMAAKCRDCSSFVSRCYWDTSLGRRLFLIGGSGAAGWAYNASAQAHWLESQGKRVSWKACAVKKLRPGDTIYFETDYAGKDASQWHYIDHAALYVGNGYYLNTGGYGGKGTVGLAGYYPQDARIKFIGRPCS